MEFLLLLWFLYRNFDFSIIPPKVSSKTVRSRNYTNYYTSCP